MAYRVGSGGIALGQEDLEESIKILEENTFRYADEAWENHRDQVLEALRTIDQCKNLAFQTKKSRLVDLCMLWDEEQWLKEGETICREGYYEEVLELSSAGRNIPLKGILMSVIRDMDEEPWWERAANGMLFRPKLEEPYEWYILCIYFAGAKAIYTGRVWERDSFRTWKDGNFPNWEGGSVFSRTLVPEQWLKDYDEYNQKLLEEREERARVRQKKEDQKKREHEHLVKGTFDRIFGEMEESGLLYILKHTDCRTLAAALPAAGEPVRNRLLENMTEKQRELVEKQWRLHGNGKHSLSSFSWSESMDQMLIIAGLAEEEGKCEAFDVGQVALIYGNRIFCPGRLSFAPDKQGNSVVFPEAGMV